MHSENRPERLLAGGPGKSYARLMGILFAGGLFFLLALDLVYLRWGHPLITAMYDKTAFWPLNRVITFQSQFPLEHYLESADQALKGLNLILVLLLGGIYGIVRFSKEDKVRQLLLILLWVDFCFIVLHLTHFAYWSLDKDRDFPELFQYAMELFLTGAFFLYFKKTRQPIFLWLGAVFLVALADDALRIHERLSFALAHKFEISFLVQRTGVIAKHLWEFAIFGVLGLTAFVFFILAYWKSERSARRFCRRLIPWLFLLFFFAAILDFVHDFPAFLRIYRLTLLIEDSGEMIVLSVLCYLVFKISRAPEAAPA